MTTTIIIISIYVALVFIGYGMILQNNEDSELGFITVALIIWATVPFLTLIIFGRWISSLRDKLNNELNNE